MKDPNELKAISNRCFEDFKKELERATGSRFSPEDEDTFRATFFNGFIAATNFWMHTQSGEMMGEA